MEGVALFDAVIKQLQDLRRRDVEEYHTPEEPTWPKSDFEQYRLQWRPCNTPYTPEPTLRLEEVRDRIVDRILSYTTGEDTNPMLLLRVPPGVGKTTASVIAIQQYVSRSTRRVLYTASRRNFFDELRIVPGFRQIFWWNWLPLMCEDPITCRYGPEMMVWIAKGYTSFDLCRQLCMYDGWIDECPYRKQRHRSEPIIFGRHAHLIHGMAIDDYDLGICDEVPVSAFLETKRIPASDILVPHLEGVLRNLVRRLYHHTRIDQKIHGRQLMDVIGDVVGAVYEEIDVGGVHIPDVPSVHTADDVMKVPYFYVFDLLKTLSKEYECYRNGWARWVPRVIVGEHGITIYGRNYVQEMWSDTDTPLVLLDATGNADLYRRLFNREVTEYAPHIERKGRIFQIVNRLNGVGSVYQHVSARRVDLTKAGREMLVSCKLIADEYTGRVGIITFKKIEKLFTQVFGEENVLHYGGLRGSNLLETCDCLILAGGYCPNLVGLRYIAAALNPRRMRPFYALDENDRMIHPWTQKECEYEVKDTSRGIPFRPVRGYWHDPDLNILLEEYRRNEIVQAIHRNRPVNKPCDVWVLTNIPTPERLDGIYESLSDLDFTPDRYCVNGRNYRGITIPHWYAIKEKLDGEWCQKGTRITFAMLAEVTTGVKENTIEHDKWIPTLIDFCERTGRPWEAQEIVYVGPGRRQKWPKNMRYHAVR